MLFSRFMIVTDRWHHVLLSKFEWCGVLVQTCGSMLRSRFVGLQQLWIAASRALGL